MFNAASTTTYRRLAFVGAMGLALVGLLAGPVDSMDALYERAAKAFAAGEGYEPAAAAIIARGDEAVAHLTAKAIAQADRVGKANDLEGSGIRMTLNLLGRMNSYARVRVALARLKRHPVSQLAKWAVYALGETPQTQPVRRVFSPTATTGPATTGPASRPGVDPDPDFIVTAHGRMRRRKPRTPAPKLPMPVTRTYIIKIHGSIGPSMAAAVRRKIIKCKGDGAELVIFDMDTLGGRTDAMSDITRLITEDLAGIYSVAYIKPKAMSAGAVISLACDEIVMAPGSKTGDAMPILISPEGGLVPVPEAEREKFESYGRAEIRVIAKHNGYNVPLCEAMVTRTVEVWKIQNPETAEVRFVDASDPKHNVIGAPGDELHRSAPSGEGLWEYVSTIDSAKKLLTMDDEEALALGFTRHVFKDMDALKKHFNVVEKPRLLGDRWSERTVGFLSHPAVLGFLMFVAMLCGFIEMNSPGFGIAGGVAILCAALVVGIQLYSGTANFVEVALVVLGLILLGIEIFVTPGFGALGVTGILCCLVGVLAMFMPNAIDEWPVPKTALDRELFGDSVFALVSAFIAAAIGAVVLARYLPDVPLAGRLVLKPPKPATGPPVPESAEILAIREGHSGTVVQTCRPVGKVRVDGVLCDAIADGAFLEAGTTVVVLRNEGNRVVIEEKKA